MESDAEKCVERFCEEAKNVSSPQQMATPCMDDHLIPAEDCETTGDFCSMCSDCSEMPCIRQALDEQISHGQSTLWHDQ